MANEQMSNDRWPAWRYGPDGASEIFEREEDVPNGWKDHPSKVVKTAADPADPAFAKFDRNGDGKPGGSLPGPRKRKAGK